MKSGTSIHREYRFFFVYFIAYRLSRPAAYAVPAMHGRRYATAANIAAAPFSIRVSFSIPSVRMYIGLPQSCPIVQSVPFMENRP